MILDVYQTYTNTVDNINRTMNSNAILQITHTHKTHSLAQPLFQLLNPTSSKQNRNYMTINLCSHNRPLWVHNGQKEAIVYTSKQQSKVYGKQDAINSMFN